MPCSFFTESCRGTRGCTTGPRRSHRGREDDAEAERGDEGPEQLGPPIDGRESRRDLPSHERAEGHGGVEVPARNPREGRDHHSNRKTMSKGDQEEIAPSRGKYGAGADENQCEGPDELRDGLPPGRDCHLAPPRAANRRGVLEVSRPEFEDEVRHAMYDADPRTKPRTNSRLNSEGCHAASGNTRFGTNRVLAPEIWVTRASTANNVSRIRWDCSRQTRSSTKPREWRYSCRRT